MVDFPPSEPSGSATSNLSRRPVGVPAESSVMGSAPVCSPKISTTTGAAKRHNAGPREESKATKRTRKPRTTFRFQSAGSWAGALSSLLGSGVGASGPCLLSPCWQHDHKCGRSQQPSSPSWRLDHNVGRRQLRHGVAERAQVGDTETRTPHHDNRHCLFQTAKRPDGQTAGKRPPMAHKCRTGAKTVDKLQRTQRGRWITIEKKEELSG